MDWGKVSTARCLCRSGEAFVALLALPNDDVTAQDFVAFYCDGTFGKGAMLQLACLLLACLLASLLA